jgi:hypothetical protein
MQSAGSRLMVAAVAASALSVAGCNAGNISPSLSSNGAPTAANRVALPDAGTSYAYTCQNVGGSDCLIYKNGKLDKTLKSKSLNAPAGVAAGKDGLFYVANGGAANVLVFSAGGKSLVQTVNNGGNTPVDVAVLKDALAVSNASSMTYFSAGASKPTRTLKDSDAKQGRGAAFDLKGNCYWSLTTKHSGVQVDEFKGCKGKAQRLNISSGSPYGLAFDDSGNLWFASYLSSANGVYECKGVSSCELVYNQFVDPQYLNFSSDFSDLWVSDTGNYQYGAFLYEIQVSNGKVLKKIFKGLSFFDPPSGVAAGPGPL